VRVRHPYFKTAIGAAIVAILLSPVYWMVLTSLRSEADAAHSPPLLPPKALQTAAYKAAVLDNSAVQHAIVNSTMISFGTMALTLVLASTPWNQVMAVATVVAVPIVAVFVSPQRYIVGGLTIGGIKE
jgi:ABC-type glycerol-3-phosphate transport system permease component